MSKHLILSTAVALAFAATAFAQDFEIDGDHSNVGFTVRHLVSKVNGEFKKYDGEFSFDEQKPEDSKVKFTVKTASITTGNVKRDEHLRSPDFFDAKKFPTLTFVGKKFTADGDKKYKLEGDLTMHGVTKPAVWETEFLGSAKDFEGHKRLGFTATTKVNRKEFGISWSKSLDGGGLVVSDEVTLNVQVEAVEKGAK